MDFMRCTDAPEYQRSWEDDKTDEKRPEAVFGFHRAVVPASESDSEPVAESTGEHSAMYQLALNPWESALNMWRLTQEPRRDNMQCRKGRRLRYFFCKKYV